MSEWCDHVEWVLSESSIANEKNAGQLKAKLEKKYYFGIYYLMLRVSPHKKIDLSDKLSSRLIYDQKKKEIKNSMLLLVW